jgi:hypothetical protein
MIQQSPLTVLSEIVPERIVPLRQLLQQIDCDVEGNGTISFALFPSVHFARFVIIEPMVEDKMHPTWLAFSVNYDGTLDELLSELYTHAGSGFDSVYSHCRGYQAGGANQFHTYIHDHKLPYPNAFYVGHRGLTVKTILKQNKIRKAIEEFLNTNSQQSYPADQVKKNIVNHLRTNYSELMEEVPPEIKQKSIWEPILLAIAVIFFIRFVFGWKVLAGLFLTLFILLGIAYLILRWKECTDPQIKIESEESLVSQITSLTSREDFTVQNQLTHLVAIKPGWFRLGLLKFVLWGINLLALVLYNKGKLGNIPTIHFARWVTIDHGKRLLFFSNFDGSWESYLGDFVDKAAVGLTAVWSNTNLFPKTKNLIQDGATDEQRFKYWTRVHQIPTQVWYTAYKSLSVVNVLNNNLIHQGLFKTMTPDECKQWLLKL